jgi:hypothetical protein
MTNLKHSTTSSSTPIIPPHLRDLDEAARAAGLEVSYRTQFEVIGTQIHRTWRGTAEAFRSMPCWPAKMAFPKRAKKVWSPYFRGEMYPLDANYELVMDPEPLPAAVEPMKGHPGVAVIDYRTDVAHYGDAEALLRAGVLTEGQLPHRGKWIRRGGLPDGRAWETRKTFDGRIICMVGKMKEQIEAAQRPEYDSPRDYIQTLLHLATVGMAMILRQAKAAQKGPRAFRLAPDSLEGIEDAMRELFMAIESAIVLTRTQDSRTDTEQAAARKLVAQAETDPRFRGMLRDIVADPPFQAALKKLGPSSGAAGWDVQW